MRCRFKENRSCSRLIAEGLEEAGAVQESGEPFTPAQVTRGLKRLGLSRVIGKTTQNELLRSIRSQSDDENGSGSDNEGDGQQTDAAENVDFGNRSDEEMSDDDGNIQDVQATDKKQKRKSDAADVQGGKRRRRTGLFSEEQDHKLQSLFEK